MEIILGVVVSVVAQVIKTKFGTGEYKTLATVAGLSLLGAGAYTFLVSTGYWESVLHVLTTAGAFYTFIIQRFPSGGVVGGGTSPSAV